MLLTAGGAPVGTADLVKDVIAELGRIELLAWAEGLVELPEACAKVAPGDAVDYLPFSGLGLYD